MTDQEILDNAPEGATHVEVLTDYKKTYYYKRSHKDYSNKFMYEVYQQDTWYICSEISGDFRSLADIKRIAELEVENKTLSMKGTGLAEFKEYYKNLVYDATGITSTTRLIVEYKKLLSLKEQGE